MGARKSTTPAVLRREIHPPERTMPAHEYFDSDVGEFRIGLDGQVWQFVPGRGQVTRAKSGPDAINWIVDHCRVEDMKIAIACASVFKRSGKIPLALEFEFKTPVDPVEDSEATVDISKTLGVIGDDESEAA